MKPLRFLKNYKNLYSEYRQEWCDTINQKPELTNPDIWPEGRKRLYEVQEEEKSRILENLQHKYPHNIGKKVITKTDSIGFKIASDHYFIISIFDKIRDVFRRKQKYSTKRQIMNVVYSDMASEKSGKPNEFFDLKKVD